MYLLAVRTDWDFSLRYKGHLYGDNEFAFVVDSVECLDAIELCGPFGSSSPPTKVWEWAEAVRKIKQKPQETLHDYGGNRGVSWHPIVY